MVDAADTLVVNNRRATQIPVRVLDSAGHDLRVVTGVQYQWTAGDSIPVSLTGTVTCTKRADARLRVSLGGVTTNVVLRCRPVRSVHVAGPMQFILGDSSQDIPIEVLDLDGKPVNSFAMRVRLLDSTVVTVNGSRIHPRPIKGTVAEVRVGDELASFGIHVYERVGTLAGLRLEQRYVAVPLRLASAEMRRWSLPEGQWLLTMLPYEDEVRGLRLRVEGANCVPATLTTRRIVCQARSGASVIVYHPSTRLAPDLSGTLLVRRVNS